MKNSIIKMTLTIAVIGDVDASKSTLIGVLSKNIKDDGNGKARREILTMRHEKESGRTSHVSSFMISFNNQNSDKKDVNKKEIRLVDLAGHEAYLSTTLRGLTSYYPDYALLLIEGLKGSFSKMTIEHIQILYSLNIPFFIGITKTDITPLEKHKKIKSMIKQLCKKNGSFDYEIKNENLLKRSIKGYQMDPFSVIPYFNISNVTGEGIDFLKEFMYNLEEPEDRYLAIKNYVKEHKVNKLFVIHKPYYIKGIGIVVYGINMADPIKKNEILKIGPIFNEYIQVRVRSIHDHNRNDVNLLNGIGCLALKPINGFKLKKKMIKRGKICIGNKDESVFVKKIDVQVKLFNKSMTVTRTHTPYIHSSVLSASSSIENIYDDKGQEIKLLRTSENANITLRFFKNQFIYPGERLLLRDGRMIGKGIIKKVYT